MLVDKTETLNQTNWADDSTKMKLRGGPRGNPKWRVDGFQVERRRMVEEHRRETQCSRPRKNLEESETRQGRDKDKQARDSDVIGHQFIQSKAGSRQGKNRNFWN